jgi:NitT/TauT family transport system ATP-binding protein
MRAEGWDGTHDAAGAGGALARALARPPLARVRFAVVHPHSGHNYDLRYWLAASGIEPDRDVEIVILPPPLMADALAAGHVQGFCVGEPWSTVAVRAGAGVIATTKSAIWRASPDKVLAVSAGFAAGEEAALLRLLGALHRAAEWCKAPENHRELARLLARDEYIGQPSEAILPGLSGRLAGSEGPAARDPGFFLPFAEGATLARRGHALWFLSQMVRWGHATYGTEAVRLAAETYRPELYARALGRSPADEPGRLPAVGGFFDGERFEPASIAEYIEGQRRPA